MLFDPCTEKSSVQNRLKEPYTLYNRKCKQRKTVCTVNNLRIFSPRYSRMEQRKYRPEGIQARGKFSKQHDNQLSFPPTRVASWLHCEGFTGCKPSGVEESGPLLLPLNGGRVYYCMIAKKYTIETPFWVPFTFVNMTP